MRLHHRLRRDHGRHADDWLITYADTITLLLCLFVVILSVKTSGGTLRSATVAQVSNATRSEDIFAGIPPFAAFTRVIEPVVDEAPPTIIADAAGPIVEPPRPVKPVAPRAAPPPPVSDPFAANAPRQEAEPAPVAERPKSTASAEPRGDRITSLQISSAAFFGSGDAALSGAGKSILRDVAVTLKSERFASYRISIEGHTDDSPISTPQFQSNWELSTARAAAVVRFFLEQGIPAQKLTAAGYADTFPIAPNRNADGTVIPENQAKNRRVVIKLEKIDIAER